MRELRRRVAHADRTRHAQTFQHLRLPLHRVGRRLAGVELQVHHGRADELHRRKALVIGPRLQQPLQHVGGHRLARLVVPRMGLQHRGHLQPVLVKLAWQFHEIAGNARCR